MFRKIRKLIEQFSHGGHRSRSYSRSGRRGYGRSYSSSRGRRHNPFSGSQHYKRRRHSSS